MHHPLLLPWAGRGILNGLFRMMRINPFFCPIIIGLLFSLGLGQEIQPEITDQKYRLIILPSEKGDDESSIQYKLVEIVADAASQLERYEVFNRQDLKKIFAEQALYLAGVINDSSVIEFGQIAGAKEAMLIKLIQFDQRGIPPAKDDDYDNDYKETNFYGIMLEIFSDAIVDIIKASYDKIKTSYDKKKKEPYANNIQTALSFSVKTIDVETGQALDSHYIRAVHTGGWRGKSLRTTLLQARSKLSLKLRQMYKLTNQVLEVDRKEVILILGEEMGVKKGTIFEISSLDEMKNFGDREVAVPGKSVALVRVEDMSSDANRSQIVRRWGKIKKGYKATEKQHSIPVSYFMTSYGSAQSDFYVGTSGGPDLFNKLNLKVGFHLGSALDSRNHYDFYIGGPFGLTYNLIHSPYFSLDGSVNTQANLVFRKDDAGNTVAAFYSVSKIGLETVIMNTSRWDWVFGLEYAFASHTGGWGYSEGDGDNSVSKPAVWDKKFGPSPTIKPSGLYITVGVRFLDF